MDVPVPGQPNHEDCGLYVIHLVKIFVKHQAKMMTWIHHCILNYNHHIGNPQKPTIEKVSTLGNDVSSGDSPSCITFPTKEVVAAEDHVAASRKRTCSKSSSSASERGSKFSSNFVISETHFGSPVKDQVKESSNNQHHPSIRRKVMEATHL
ncbi:uncharacterized protein MELLADRAFT_61503 [Melampsora larici-populina 98AG31]|uniref:Ubiquitin-like protease family profile domain-containing protein n=1 Tax=Melampsora larici-populina (strain 98AG31 / pathotype 3-4-7) TaxID=747676 RepID=F4RF67_MELLP|nr:uncharacterized protein MELLADRAFT_61503 [Melampsora larici-populina 98AG31]EGG08760.1 hypothetical protein MELLADRAFT_61503 [Melampsora larici-populina 98AG31]